MPWIVAQGCTGTFGVKEFEHHKLPLTLQPIACRICLLSRSQGPPVLQGIDLRCVLAPLGAREAVAHGCVPTSDQKGTQMFESEATNRARC